MKDDFIAPIFFKSKAIWSNDSPSWMFTIEFCGNFSGGCIIQDTLNDKIKATKNEPTFF
jgi:hypothetical protein